MTLVRFLDLKFFPSKPPNCKNFKSTALAGQNGVNRPLCPGVNVFFTFGLNDTYQMGQSWDVNDGEIAAESHAVTCRSASRDRSHRRGHACAVDRTRRDYRSTDRGEKDRGDRFRVPPAARSRDDAPAGAAPSRQPAP